MEPKKVYRKADVSRATATQDLLEQYPDADFSLTKKKATAHEAKLTAANEGDEIYVATVKVAEFPPPEGGPEGAPEDKPKDDAPDDTEDEPSEDDPTDPMAENGGGEDPLGKPKPLKGEELTNHLLQQILDAVKGGGDLGAGPDDGAGLDLPDIGAPDKSQGLPGPKAPLPPPVPPKGAPGMGGGAFSKALAGIDNFKFARSDVKKDGISIETIKREAMQNAPGFTVTKIDLRTKTAEDIALVHMARVEA